MLGNYQIGFQCDNVFQIYFLLGGNLFNFLCLWRIVGIVVDFNWCDFGGKGKFSVGGRKCDDVWCGVELQWCEKRQGDQCFEQ